MLRTVLLAVFLALFAAAAAGLVAGAVPWPPVLVLGLLLAAILFERRRYSDGVGATAREPLSPTGERFLDPATGRPVQVWTNSRGDRHYAEEPAPGD
jgi:uncharacterized protein (TIGR03382 family)